MKKKVVKKYTRIRNMREDHDLSQSQIANIIGMSQTGYSKYETGENEIPSSVLSELADYYGTSVDYLLGRTDEITAYPKSKKK